VFQFPFYQLSERRREKRHQIVGFFRTSARSAVHRATAALLQMARRLLRVGGGE
jgi:hypothetical protein